MDSADVRRRKLFHLLTTRSVLFPAVVGAALLSISVLARNMGWAGWTGVCAIGVSCVVAVCRWFFAAQALHQQAVDHTRRQAEQEHLVYLKQLRRRLRRDRDPQTGRCLMKLRKTHKRLSTLDSRMRRGVSPVLDEVRAQARQLYQACLELLERSLVVWNASQQMATDEGRARLRKLRDELLDEVQLSIDRLDTTLDRLQIAAIGNSAEHDEHSRLRAELDEGLAVARRVRERMDELERDVSSHGDIDGDQT